MTKTKRTQIAETLNGLLVNLKAAKTRRTAANERIAATNAQHASLHKDYTTAVAALARTNLSNQERLEAVAKAEAAQEAFEALAPALQKARAEEGTAKAEVAKVEDAIEKEQRKLLKAFPPIPEPTVQALAAPGLPQA